MGFEPKLSARLSFAEVLPYTTEALKVLKIKSNYHNIGIHVLYCITESGVSLERTLVQHTLEAFNAAKFATISDRNYCKFEGSKPL